jgi:uncharacterized membrane protein YfcA
VQPCRVVERHELPEKQAGETHGGSQGGAPSGATAARVRLVNSLAAIAGCVSATTELLRELVYWAIAAAAGGMLGSELGVKLLGQTALRRLLALLLIFNRARMIAKN